MLIPVHSKQRGNHKPKPLPTSCHPWQQNFPQSRVKNFTYKNTKIPKLNHHHIDTTNANPSLQQPPKYLYTKHHHHSPITKSIPTNPPTYSPTSIQPSYNDEDTKMDVDDMISDEIYYPIPSYTDDPSYHIDPPPMSNIFMNHPHFNKQNTIYQKAMNQYLHTNNCLVTKTTTFQIPTNVIQLPIISPSDPNKTVTIEAAADTQSDIEAIGFTKFVQYQSKGLVRTDNTGVTIATGNGMVHIKHYVPITVLSRTGQKFTRKFWCLESLPSYDFLLGKHLLHRLGWEFVNKYETWEHKPQNLDYIDEELDELRCTNYPVAGQPDLDLDAVRIPNPQLEPFIREQLTQYKDVIAKHEWDSGRILDLKPFRIDFKDANHPYKDGFISKEYWTNPDQKAEVNRQLEGMVQYKLIEEVKDGKCKYISPNSSKTTNPIK